MVKPNITRLPDWPERLIDYFERMKTVGFEWGKNDCILFALGAAQVMTGIDTAKDFRGLYKTALGAARVMQKRFGTTNLSEAADAFKTKWESEEILNVLMAQRGDIVEADVVSAEGGSGPSLGVVDLDGTHALFAGPSGTIRIKITDCRRAWRVG